MILDKKEGNPICGHFTGLWEKCHIKIKEKAH
jgi:hypothetical protein